MALYHEYSPFLELFDWHWHPAESNLALQLSCKCHEASILLTFSGTGYDNTILIKHRGVGHLFIGLAQWSTLFCLLSYHLEKPCSDAALGDYQ